MKSLVLNAIVLILVAGTLILQLSKSKELDERLASLETASQQQTAVMHRALGKVIPVELPASLESTLVSLEQRIRDQKTWPQDEPGSAAMQNELDELVVQIPAWAEEDLLPRLNVVRWGVSSARLLATANDVKDDGRAAMVDTLDAAIDAAPAGAPDGLLAALSRSRDVQEAKLTHFQKSQLTTERRTFLADTARRMEKALEEKDAPIRQILLAKVLDDVVAQRLSLVDEPEDDPVIGAQLTRLLERLRTEVERDSTARDKAWREYQKWALEQIKSFNSEYEKAVGGLMDKVDRAKIRDAMVKYLVPISTNSLDSAVSRLYDAAFNKGWSKLQDAKDTNGVDLQFYVASQEFVVGKRRP